MTKLTIKATYSPMLAIYRAAQGLTNLSLDLMIYRGTLSCMPRQLGFHTLCLSPPRESDKADMGMRMCTYTKSGEKG